MCLKEFVWRMILPFYKIIVLLQKKCRFDVGSFITRETELEGYNYVGRGSSLINCKMGYGSYMAEDSKLVLCKIGRYTSIASRVYTVIGSHPTKDWVSTNPSFFSLEAPTGLSYVTEQKYAEHKETEEKYMVSIGNDVWIGQGVNMMEGVDIGDGAIVAAGALVTKDVPPYAIVAGMPAKIIRYRFSPEEIAHLLQVRWWDKDTKWIKEHAPYYDAYQNFHDKLCSEESER